MSDKKQAEKVVFNNDVFELEKKQENMSNRERIIHVDYPQLREWGNMALFIGLVLTGGAFGYNLGSVNFGNGSRSIVYIGVISFFVFILGLIMIHYSQDVYYKKVD